MVFLKALLAIVILCSSFSAIAEEVSSLTKEEKEALVLNVTSLERKRKGYSKYPVVQCPGIKAKYLDMLENLAKIQEQIKKEACKTDDEKIEVEKEIDNVQQLIGPGRKEFATIINKGLSKGGEITEEEASKVRNYVSEVIKTTAKVTGLTKTSTCFEDEEKKNITLATLSSVVSEVSGTLGAISGPLGAKINLGGNVISGIMDSVGSIMTARETYCSRSSKVAGWNIQNPWATCKFTKASEQAFVNTLCSYYQLKFDIDEITNPDARLIELTSLMRELDVQLPEYYEECEECAEIIDSFMPRLSRGEELPDDEVIFTFPFDQGRILGQRYVNPELVDENYEELLQTYEDQVRASRQNYVIPKGVKGPSYYTVRSLRTYAWARQEAERVDTETNEDDADVALRQVSIEQERIEEVLFKDEAPKFIEFAAYRAAETIQPFMENVYAQYSMLNKAEEGVVLQPDPNHQYSTDVIYLRDYSGYSAGQVYIPMKAVFGMLHEVFRFNSDGSDNLEILDSFSESLTDPEIVARKRNVRSLRNSVREDILRELKLIKRNYAIFRDYCRLFEYGKLKYHKTVGKKCIDGHGEVLTKFKSLFRGLIEETALGQYAEIQAQTFGRKSTTLSDVIDPDKAYQKDWVASLTELIKEQNKKYHQLQRRVLPLPEHDIKSQIESIIPGDFED